MAKPINVNEQTGVLQSPSGMEDEVGTLPVATVAAPHKQFVSCWRFNDEELEEIKKTGKFYVGVLGSSHPPVWIDAENPFLTDSSGLESAKRYPVITICGSGKFLDTMLQEEQRLTLAGYIVLMLGVKKTDVQRSHDLNQYKDMLDEMHLRKIDMADEVYIVDIDGYVGESTKNEIEYATIHGKPISYFSNQKKDEV